MQCASVSIGSMMNVNGKKNLFLHFNVPWNEMCTNIVLDGTKGKWNYVSLFLSIILETADNVLSATYIYIAFFLLQFILLFCCEIEYICRCLHEHVSF